MLPFKLLRLSVSTLRQYRALPEEQRIALREDAQLVRELTVEIGGSRARQMLAGDGLLGRPSANAPEPDPVATAPAPDAAAPPATRSEAETIEELRRAVSTLALSIAQTGLVGGNSRGAALGRRILKSGLADRLDKPGGDGRG
ncbi:hypothetical protein [Patulibacter defluvii]|uniref:hypothetical protein n=1 Tax=Patulibacter defluvii TaxID=3095358 RepID=UPI002A750092|nr:hypothetical protein [Patulibacter sp. DM4]